MSKSRQKHKVQQYSDNSDIDSTVTPIDPAEDGPHGQIIESDSLSDFYLHDIRGRRHRDRRRKNPEYDGEESDDEGTPRPSKENIKQIYKELQIISNKLKEENKILYEKEQKLKERERMVSISSENIQTITEHGVKQKLQAIENKYLAEITKLDQTLKEKNRENKRLKDSFETLKQANDALKKEFECLQCQHEKLEKQAVSVQARLTNLQRKQDFASRQKEIDLPTAMGMAVPKQKPNKDVEDKSKAGKSQKMYASCTFDVMGVLLDWICDAYLRHTVTEQPTKLSERPDYVQERVMKILPSSVDLLKEFPAQNLKISLPCIQFIYWSLVHVEQGPGSQKSSLSSTLRRLGEEMYRAKTVRFSENERVSSAGDSGCLSPTKPDKSKEGVYFRSTNLHVRLLSSFIILKTLSQVDLLAHVFDVLRNDLKSDIAKELFLYYQATPVILQYLKPVNKTFMESAMDIYLQMSMDSPFQQPFLDSCSNESWFRTIAMVLRAPSQDYKLLEKLSIILQKLSKMKTNRKFFEVYTIVGIIQELLRGCATEQAFLALNLKSILFNLASEGSQYIT